MLDKPEDSVVPPLAFSSAATEALVEEDSSISVDLRDFEGVDWSRLKQYWLVLKPKYTDGELTEEFAIGT
jgi:hypothetical protein